MILNKIKTLSRGAYAFENMVNLIAARLRNFCLLAFVWLPL